MCETNREEGEGEVRGREEGFCRKGWPSVPACNCIRAVEGGDIIESILD
jgi:hypothetical protein